MLKKECTQRAYEIDYETEILNTDEKEEAEETLVERLSLVPGVTDVDYSGHWGHLIFLTLDATYDNDATWEILEKEIGILK